MAVNDLIFEKKISLGNIIEILVLLTAVISIFATYQAKIETLQEKVKNSELAIDKHRIDSERIYVRKDVFDLIMIQLQEIRHELKDLKRSER
jgi:hypothetical protein